MKMRMGASPRHHVGVSLLLPGLYDFCLFIFGCHEGNMLHRCCSYSSSIP